MTLSSLTKSEAAIRSDLLEVQRYDIAVDMTGLLEGELFTSVSTITFTCSDPGATTFVDVAMDVRRATLNGEEVDVSQAADGRLPLPPLAAANVLVVEAEGSTPRNVRNFYGFGNETEETRTAKPCCTAISVHGRCREPATDSYATASSANTSVATLVVGGSSRSY